MTLEKQIALKIDELIELLKLNFKLKTGPKLKLYGLTDVAKAVGCNSVTIADEIEAKKLPAPTYQKPGHPRLYYRRNEFNEVVKIFKKTPHTPADLHEERRKSFWGKQDCCRAANVSIAAFNWHLKHNRFKSPTHRCRGTRFLFYTRAEGLEVAAFLRRMKKKNHRGVR